jgi:hypothetical protein
MHASDVHIEILFSPHLHDSKSALKKKISNIYSSSRILNYLYFYLKEFFQRIQSIFRLSDCEVFPTVADACKRCCRMNLNDTCFPVDPQDILPDGTPCIQGFCNKVQLQATDLGYTILECYGQQSCVTSQGFLDLNLSFRSFLVTVFSLSRS